MLFVTPARTIFINLSLTRVLMNEQWDLCVTLNIFSEREEWIRWKKARVLESMLWTHQLTPPEPLSYRFRNVKL